MRSTTPNMIGDYQSLMCSEHVHEIDQLSTNLMDKYNIDPDDLSSLVEKVAEAAFDAGIFFQA